LLKEENMPLKVGVNGFGRIGRIFYRVCIGDPNIEIVAVNDLTNAKTLAHLLKYDSVHRTLPLDVESTDNIIKVGEREIKVFGKGEFDKLNWGALGIKVVIEATGHPERKTSEEHFRKGAEQVVYTATGRKQEDSDITLVYSVNHGDYIPGNHKIVSNASCTTNCLAPICKIVMQNFGIVNGEMCTIHSYTADQRLWDSLHDDLRRARAAARSIIPTKTGAASAINLVIPELKGKMDGIAYRVPTLDVSVIHLVVDVRKDTTKEEVNKILKEAAENEFKGIVQYIDKPLVSEDYVGNPHSAIIDSDLTRVTDKRKVIIVAWYDNEWGYSCRLRDLITYMARRNGWI
jgi:glyceraldehyde 3-phosphate dehydrogenase